MKPLEKAELIAQIKKIIRKGWIELSSLPSAFPSTKAVGKGVPKDLQNLFQPVLYHRRLDRSL